MTVAYATRYSFSVFYPAILNEFHWSRAETALAFSINLVAYALINPVAGALIDRLGPRIVFPIGAVVCGLSMLGLSQINDMWQLYLLSALLAVGVSLLGYVTHAAFISNWFSSKLGTALGIAVAGMALGNVLAVPVQYIIDRVGWHGAYIALAILVVVFVVPLTATFLRRRASDMGLPLDGSEGLKARESLAQAPSNGRILKTIG